MKRFVYLLAVAVLMFTLFGCNTKSSTVPTTTQTTTPTSTVEQNWSEVVSWTVTGKKNTENFKIEDGHQYRINWETYNAEGSLAIFIYNDKGENVDTLANVKGISKDTSAIHVPAGSYYLTQITEPTTKWKATIEKQ